MFRRWHGEVRHDAAVMLAEQFRTAFGKRRIKRSGKHQDLNDTVTISIGVAQIGTGEPLEQAVDRADSALYQAKNGGRNCVRVAPPASDAGKPENDTLTVASAS